MLPKQGALTKKGTSVYNKVRYLTDPVQPGLFYKHLYDSLIHSFIQLLMLFSQIFQTSQIPNRQSQRAEILRECSPHTISHLSCVTCHVSPVICHLSHVTCHMSHVTFNFFFFFWQNGGASWRRVCYQRDLPRLFKKNTNPNKPSNLY